MRVGLFIPCYMDAFEPEVAIATLELLERVGCQVTNAGCHAESAATEALFVKNFSGYDYIVAPSGSCVHQVREHLTAIEQTDEVREVRARTFELTEFLHDILKVEGFPWASFPHKVGIHYNCNSLRGIGLASPSELNKPFYSKPLDLLKKVNGMEFAEPARWDECCGFGGTFCVFKPGISAKMGYDKVRDHAQAGAEYIVSADSSCLMQQKGCAERLGLPLRFIHIAQILNGASA